MWRYSTAPSFPNCRSPLRFATSREETTGLTHFKSPWLILLHQEGRSRSDARRDHHVLAPGPSTLSRSFFFSSPCLYRLPSALGTPFVNYWLCAASLFFYASSGAWYLAPLLFTCIFDFVVGRLIDPERRYRHRRALFITSVAIQIGLLAFFKYYGWLSGDWNTFAVAAGLGALPAYTFFLPPGISFYTFHTISYTADIYRGRFKPHGSLVDYITFVTFFPQLVAGPIARASDLLPQVAARRPPITAPQWEAALWLIAWGLFKKVVLADNFSHLVVFAEAGITPATSRQAPGCSSPMRSPAKSTATSRPTRIWRAASPSCSTSS